MKALTDRQESAHVWCPCHGFGADEVKSALKAGASTVGQVFRQIGVCAKCGDCVRAIRNCVRISQSTEEFPSNFPKERKLNNQTKVKVTVMMENGDKLEYEAHVDVSDLEAAKSEAERRMLAAVGALSTQSGGIKADKVKIETH